MAAREGAGFDADALFQGFGAQVRAPGPDSDDGLDGVVAGVNAHFAVAHKGERTDVALGQLVGGEGFNAGFGQLVGAVGQLHAQDLGGIEHALAVVLQAEDRGGAVDTGISPDAFENGTAVVQGVGEHMNLGLIPGNHFPVKPDELHCLHG